MSNPVNLKRRVGDIVAIPLEDGTYGYGRVLREPLVAFYDLRTKQILPPEEVRIAPIVFVLFVMNYALTDGLWPVIGTARLDEGLQQEPWFFKRDPVSNEYTIYNDSTGEEIRATREECMSLECAAVWEPEHVIERLVDYFEGRLNKWAESLRPT